MKRSIILAFAAALALSGCRTTSPADPYAPFALPPGKGAVVFTIDRHGRSVDRPFAIHAVRYNPQTGKVIGDSDDEGAGFAAVYATRPEVGKNDKHWAFELQPGNYAIASVDRVGVASQPTFSGGNIAVVLIATVIATAASHAIAAAEHESHPFIQDGRVGPQTPTFTIAAGRVTHIGNFSFSSESRTVERLMTNENTWGGPNATGLDSATVKPVTEIRTLVAYSFDPAAVDGYLKLRRLDRYPIDHQHLDRLIGRRFVLEDFPGETPEQRTPIRPATAAGSTVTVPPPALPAATTLNPPSPSPASVAPAPPGQGPASLDELMRQFLDGTISKADYDASRARLSGS